MRPGRCFVVRKNVSYSSVSTSETRAGEMQFTYMETILWGFHFNDGRTLKKALIKRKPSVKRCCWKDFSEYVYLFSKSSLNIHEKLLLWKYSINTNDIKHFAYEISFCAKPLILLRFSHLDDRVAQMLAEKKMGVQTWTICLLASTRRKRYIYYFFLFERCLFWEDFLFVWGGWNPAFSE